MDEKCVICQDDIVSDAYEFGCCTAKFHAKCAADFMIRGNNRCPCCRELPPLFKQENVHVDSSDSESDAEPVVTFRHGLIIAHRMAETDGRVKRSFETIKKWKTTWRKERIELKKLRLQLKPLEAEMERDIERFRKIRKKTFERKNASLIKEYVEANARRRRAFSNYANTMKRVARRGGYMGRPNLNSIVPTNF